MLFACIFVPHFAVQASLRCEPQQNGIAWSRRPVAVLDGPDTLPRVFVCNEAALQAGVEVGITKAQAGQCPGIVLRKRDLKLEEAAQAALVDSALGFTPRVESTAQGVVTLDIQGTERIFGPPQKLICAVANQAAQVGLQVNVGAASNADTALLAAKGFGGAMVIPKGNEADRLAELPVDILPVSTEQAEILEAWGIHTCRDLALLSSVAIVERLGQPGLDLQRLARGETTRVLVPVDPPLRFEESLEFEDAVTDLDSVTFALKRLLEQISSRLASRSLATDELRLTLGLEVHEDREVGKEQRKKQQRTLERVLRLPVSMQDAAVLLRLLELDLSQHSPGAAVKSVNVEARPARQRYTQGGLFSTLAPEPERLEVTLARIRGVVGETDIVGRARVGSAEVLNSNRPDDFQVSAFVAHDSKHAVEEPRQEPAVIMSMFRPPLAARVRCQSKRPIHISFGAVDSVVISAAGPWMTSGNWWKTDEWHREEWDVALYLPAGVGLYRIFRDLREGLREDQWFVEGLYD